MSDVSCSWQGQAIAALGFLAPAEEWRVDADGDVCLPEDGENPGWLIWLDGQRIKPRPARDGVEYELAQACEVSR
jgi:hypothetical protein